jgi:hypothetical protein
VDWISAGSAIGVGLGDGIVGRIPIVDKYANVHTLYRLSTLALGAIGMAADWKPAFSDTLVTSSLTLLASRIPAVVDGGGWAQMGQAVPADRAFIPAAGLHTR